MVERYEDSFLGHGHCELFYQTWQPTEARGTFVITHGLGEHSECYSQLANYLAKDRWLVVAWDMRGHGKSSGKRGFVNNFQEYTQDLEALWQEISTKLNSTKGPIILFGHSMGGLVTLDAVLKNQDLGAAAVCLSAPLLGVAVEVPTAKKKMAEIGSRWFPKLTLWNEISYKSLTRDEEMIKRMSVDALRHDRISPNLFLGMLKTIDEVFARVEDLDIPFHLQVAGQDKIVSTDSALAFFDKVQAAKKELHIYNESYHEILNDLDRDQVMKDLKNFLNQL